MVIALLWHAALGEDRQEHPNRVMEMKGRQDE